MATRSLALAFWACVLVAYGTGEVLNDVDAIVETPMPKAAISEFIQEKAGCNCAAATSKAYSKFKGDMKKITALKEKADARANKSETEAQKQAGIARRCLAAEQLLSGDAKARRSKLRAHESKDQVLDFMQDAMMKTGAFMPAEDKANLAKMDGDLADQKLEEASIRKHILLHQKAEQKHQDALDRFAALRAKFTTFSAPEDDFEEVSKKKSKKHMAKPPMGRHTMKHPVYKAPPKYSAVPAGAAATAADAKLANGADVNRKEDWKVHKETYRELHPEAFERKVVHKHIKHKAPTPLKDAEKSEHQAITTIHSTKDVIEKEPKRLTLKEAKSICVTQKKEATTKCANGKEAKALYCKEQHTSDVQCSKRGMKVAADCKVAHETAYNECLRLWKKAKKIIADRKKRLAAPMKVSTHHVETLAKKTKVCEKYDAAAAASCKKGFAAYKKTCKKKMDLALEAEEAEMTLIQKGAKKKALKKAHKKAKHAAKGAHKASKALNKAKGALAKAGASPAMSKALQKCALAKNKAKRNCMKGVRDAHDKCGALLRGGALKKKGKAKGKKKGGKKAAKKGGKKKKAAKKKKKVEVEELDEDYPEEEEEYDVDPTDPTMP